MRTAIQQMINRTIFDYFVPIVIRKCQTLKEKIEATVGKLAASCGTKRPRSPTGRDDALRRHALGVRISPRLPIRTSSPTAEAAASNPVQSAFKSPDVHHALVPQLAEGEGLNPFQCRIVACLGHQFTGA